MSERCNSILCYENCVTYRAVLAFGKTGSGTCSSNCCVNNLSMSERCNSFLRNENLVTYGAVLTLCKTGSGTCSSNCSVNNLSMSERCNSFLRNENLVTYGAVLTLCKTGSGTCSSNCSVNNLSMSERTVCSYFIIVVVASVAEITKICVICASSVNTLSLCEYVGVNVVTGGVTLNLNSFTTKFLSVEYTSVSSDLASGYLILLEDESTVRRNGIFSLKYNLEYKTRFSCV